MRRFLKRMPPKVIRQLVALHDHLRTKLFPLPKPRTTLTFDLDSVVLTVYGKLQYTPASMNSLNLQVTPPRPFSIFKGSASKNRNFTHY